MFMTSEQLGTWEKQRRKEGNKAIDALMKTMHETESWGPKEWKDYWLKCLDGAWQNAARFIEPSRSQCQASIIHAKDMIETLPDNRPLTMKESFIVARYYPHIRVGAEWNAQQGAKSD